LLVGVLLGGVSLEQRLTDGAAGARVWRLAAGVGALLGALVLVRQSMAGLALPIALVVLFGGRSRRRDAATVAPPAGPAQQRERRRRRWAATTVVLTMAVVVAPWCVRNVVVSGRPLPFGANSGLSLFVSAHQYAGDYPNRMTARDIADGYLAEVDRLLAEIDAERPPVGTSSGMDQGIGGGPEREARLDAALSAEARVVFADLKPLELARAIPARLAALWALSSPYSADHLVRAGLVALGLLGCLRRRMAHWSLWLVGAYVTAFHLVYHVEGRYTLPAWPLLLVFAGVAVVDLEAWVRRFLRRFRSSAAAQSTAASAQRAMISSTVSAGVCSEGSTHSPIGGVSASQPSKVVTTSSSERPPVNQPA
jgi:hypothetical protein